MELLSGFEFLSCCQHSETEQTPAHHENECNADGCVAVESGFYQQARPQQLAVKPLPVLVVWLVPLPEEGPVGALGCPVRLSYSPPELPRIWLFLQRAALPPRAPSFVF